MCVCRAAFILVARKALPAGKVLLTLDAGRRLHMAPPYGEQSLGEKVSRQEEGTGALASVRPQGTACWQRTVDV